MSEQLNSKAEQSKAPFLKRIVKVEKEVEELKEQIKLLKNVLKGAKK